MGYETPYLRELRERGVRLPAVLCNIRTDEGRERRKDKIELFRFRFKAPRTDGLCGTITGILKDNLIMTTTDITMELTYHEHPTRDDLLEFFGRRIKVRKMHEREAMRLMDVDDADIDKIMNATETVALKNGTTKTKKAISKTAIYRLAGNSICTSCLYHIFRTLFIPGQPENKTKEESRQMTIFDYL